MDYVKFALRSAFILLILLPVLAGCAQGPDEDIAALHGTVSALSTRNAEQESAIATQTFLIQYALTRPAVVVTPAGPGTPPTPYRPVGGRVSIEDGRCCVSGPAGEPLQLLLNLAAGSPDSEVTEMRIAVGGRFLSEEEMEDVPWEPFAAHKTVTVPVPLNWSGSYASVQFRDAAGEVSFLYHDDIAVEGTD